MKTHDELSLGINYNERTGTKDKSIANWFTNSVIAFEKNRFGLMAAFMVLQVCLASIAVYYIFQNEAPIWHLAVIALATSASNAKCIAQASSKLCVGAFYASIISSVLIILVNL